MTLEALKDVQQQMIEEAKHQPAEHWVKPTLSDRVEDLASFGEARLKRNGYPPLTAGESWLNAFTLGAIADKRFREYERTRMLERQPNGAADEGEEDVIDVSDFVVGD